MGTEYIKDYGLLSSSGVGVILTRTREPYRAMEALMDHGKATGMPVGLWDVVNGWVVDEHKTPMPDGSHLERHKLTEITASLKWLLDVDGAGKNARKSGIYVMNAVHHWLGKNPVVTECLRQYVRKLSQNPKVRLVLVTPETTTLGDELSHDIPVVDFDLPSLDEIGELFNYVIDSGAGDEDAPLMFETEAQRQSVLSSAAGLTQMEVEVAFSKALVENRPSDGPWHAIPYNDFNATVLAMKTEVVKQSEVLELMEPVSMEDVGGLDVLKEWVEVAASTFSDEARAYGVDTPDGIAAVGPPGTGKTLVGKAIASYLGQPLVKFDVSKCYGSLVGESEGRVRSALKQLEAMGRVTVLFDEVDKSLGGSHTGGGDSGVSRRVLGAILTFMQETKAPIFPIYTANRVDSLPPELLRKGRLDEVFAVMPPNAVEREAIFKIHLRKRKQNPRVIRDLAVAVQASKGYVSSELEAGVREAVKYAFYQKMPVTGALIADMLGNMRPISQAFAEDFARMEEWARNNARLASTPLEEPETGEDNHRANGGPGSFPGGRRRRSVGN